MHGDGQRQEGEGEHGAADAADTGNETTGEPADKNKDIKCIGHGILLFRPGMEPCPCRRHGSYRALPPAARHKWAFSCHPGGMMPPSSLAGLPHGKAPMTGGMPRLRSAGIHHADKGGGISPLPKGATALVPQGYARDAMPDALPQAGVSTGTEASPWHLPSPCPPHVPKGTTSLSRSTPHRPFARTVLCRKDRRPTGAHLPGPRTAGEVHAVR